MRTAYVAIIKSGAGQTFFDVPCRILLKFNGSSATNIQSRGGRFGLGHHMNQISERVKEQQARVDSIFQTAKSAKQRVRDVAFGIARHGAHDPESLTLDEVELLCQWVLDSTIL